MRITESRLRRIIREEISRSMDDRIQEGFLDTVKGALTGANKLVDKVVSAIDKNFSLKNSMYEDYVIQRDRPESAIRSHMATFRKRFDQLFSDAGVAEEQRPQVEKLLLPKLVDLMSSMDQARMSRA